MIEVKALVKNFERKRALDGLDMSVPRGAVYGLVGPNGAGKSTLIRHLTGIYLQDSGEVLIEGKPVFDNPAIKAEIAYIPDEIPYWAQATVNDMGRFYASFYPGFDTDLCDRLQKEFCLDGKLMMRKLSKGQQKLAAFQFALAQRPRIVILDEPVDGLDPVNRRAIWGLLLENVAEHGTTVLVSSHNLRELEDVCDHVGIMNNGKILLERSRKGQVPIGRGDHDLVRRCEHAGVAEHGRLVIAPLQEFFPLCERLRRQRLKGLAFQIDFRDFPIQLRQKALRQPQRP